MIIVGVEKVRKVRFLHFGDSEGLRQTGQSLEKKVRSYEADAGQKASELEDLSTVTDLP